MKPTGTLIFTRNPDGSVSHKWEGGRRIKIQGQVIAHLTGDRKRQGDLVDLGGIQLRIIGHDFTESVGSFHDAYIAMREGILARVAACYVKLTFKVAERVWRWEMFAGPRPYIISLPNGADIPKWSLTGILLRWV